MQSRFTILIPLILFIFVKGSNAQITISSNDFVSPLGDTLIEVGVLPLTLQAPYLAPPPEGAAQTWDYRWLEYTGPSLDPELEGSDPAFPTANNIDEIGGFSDFTPAAPVPLRLFERYDTEGRTVLGERLDNSVTLPFVCGSCTTADSVRYEAITNEYEEPDRLLQLPLAFEDNWTSSYTRQFDMTLFLPTFSLLEVAAQQVDSFEVSNEVSGWGTLTLPNLTFSGTQDIEVLMVRQVVTKKSTYTVDGADPPQALLDTLGVSQGQQKVTTTYKFYAKGLDQPALTVVFNPGAPFPVVTVAGSISDINPEEEGRFVSRVIPHGGQLRNYFLFVPPGYTGAEPTPLVVGIHGYSSSASQFAWQSQLNYVADTAGFITVYPQGLLVDNAREGGPLPPRAPGWNLPDRGFDSGNDDVDFINSVVEDVANRLNVDLAKVYATGISNGGFMTTALACELPERFAAVAMGAGTFLCERSRPIPTFIIHGTDDILVPFSGDPNFDLPPVPQTAAGYAEQNGCSASPDSTDLPDIDPNDGTTITKFTYSGCEEGAEVVFYRVNNGGHVWEGTGPVPPLFQPILGAFVNRDIHASVEIWNFFNRFENPDPAPVARLLEKTITVDGLERDYLLYVPAAYDGSEDWPLVFNLHGAGSNARAQMIFSGMNEVADTAHFLAVYPEGILNPEGTTTGWNVSLDSDRQDDVNFVSKMIDAISNEYNISDERIYSTGMSNGGGMSFTLSCAFSNRIAAVATVATPGILENCNPERPVPFLYIHGTADIIVPFEGGQSQVVPQVFPAARDRVQFWVDNNGCSGDPEIIEFPDVNTADGSTVTLERYTDCEASTEIYFYIIEGGGHTWPGGPAAQIPPGFEPFFGNINRDINASVEIWNFFNRFTLQTTTVSTLTTSEIDLQVFPNPFSSQLTFTFELPETSQVQLSIFNQLGQELSTVVNERLAKGGHRVIWNAQSQALPAGMYYYRLRVGDRFVSKPVVLTR